MNHVLPLLVFRRLWLIMLIARCPLRVTLSYNALRAVITAGGNLGKLDASRSPVASL